MLPSMTQTRPPPGPSDPAIVQRVRYLRDPIGYLSQCQRRYGDVFSIRLTPRGMVMVCTPDVVKDVYTAGDALVAGEAKIAIFGKILGSSSTLLLDGDAHLRRRRLLLPRFRGDVLKQFAPLMAQVCEGALGTISVRETFALHPILHAIAFDVIAETLFATTPIAHREPLEAAMREFAHRAVTTRLLMFPPLQRDLGKWSPWGRVLAVVERARAAVDAEIARRGRGETSRDDLVALLLATRDEDGSQLSDLEIRDEVLTMVAAGHETTAMALAWACYAIYSRPAVLAKLRAEVAGKSLDELDDLPYLDAVLRESLRLYSVIPNGSGRLAKRDIELGGYTVPAGAMVSVAFHLLHRKASVFERADEFWPERFLSAKYSPYEWVAFGGGTRRCIGMPFALLELKIVLARLVQRFDLEIVQRDVRPVWRGAFMTPSQGLRVRAAARA